MKGNGLKAGDDKAANGFVFSVTARGLGSNAVPLCAARRRAWQAASQLGLRAGSWGVGVGAGLGDQRPERGVLLSLAGSKVPT